MADFADLIDMVDATAKSLLGGELVVADAVLTRVTPGTRTPGALGAGTNPTTADYPCSAIVEAFETALIDGTIVKREDRRIWLIGESLPDGIEPKPSDRITVGGTTYNVLGVPARDAASFKYICHGRK